MRKYGTSTDITNFCVFMRLHSTFLDTPVRGIRGSGHSIRMREGSHAGAEHLKGSDRPGSAQVGLVSTRSAKEAVVDDAEGGNE